MEVIVNVWSILVCASMVGLEPPDRVDWHTDYAQAWSDAQLHDKPIFALFTNGGSPPAPADLGPLAQQFVLLVADKGRPAGRSLFDLFEMAGDGGCVVIERSLRWQYCRFERSLSTDELRQLLDKTQGAIGAPASHVRLAGSTEYEPPATRQGRICFT